MVWTLAAIGITLAFVLFVIAFGTTLPREHVATVRIRLAASPSAVWTIISDPFSAGSWRKDVKTVEVLPDRDGRRAWREISSNGTITFVLEASVAGKNMVTRIDDSTLPFGGHWEYVLETNGDATVLTITERGIVKPPLFRFMSRFVFGYTFTMQRYLTALAMRLGENSVPEVVASGN